jgi:hypothetical protein
VHIAKVFLLVLINSCPQSKQDVLYGIITLVCPLKPSVPPSIKGITVEGSGFPSSSNSTKS